MRKSFLLASILIALVAIVVLYPEQFQFKDDLPPWPLYKVFIFVNSWMEKLRLTMIPPSVLVMEYATRYWHTHTMRAVAKLNIPDVLGDQTLSCQELAEQLGKSHDLPPFNKDNLCRLMNAAQSIGVFKIDSSERYTNNGLSRALMKDEIKSIRGFLLSISDPSVQIAWEDLHLAVKTGECPFETNHNGKLFWDWLNDNPEKRKLFDNSMKSVESTALLHSLTEDYPEWNKHKIVCDVGGGLGTLLTMILKKHTSIEQAYLVDAPDVIAQSKRRFETEEPSQVREKTKFLAGDFFNITLPRCDAYIVKQILHDWPDKESIEILSNIRRHMDAGSRLIIIDTVMIHDDPLPLKRAFIDLHMMATLPLGARERTQPDFVKVFTASSLQLESIWETRGPYSIQVTKPI